VPRLAPLFLLGVVSMATPLTLAAAPADSLAPAPRAIALPFDGGPRPTLTARRAEGPIRVDGRLDEPDWALADVATDLRRFEIREGEAPSESTWVQVLFDDERVIFGVRCANRTAGAVRSSLAPRDQNTDDDLVALHLDTYLDRRRAYLFGVNPHGVQLDGILVGGEPDFSWDAVWDAEVARDDAGWTAEIAIPFRSIRFPADGPGVWGLWVRRQITKHDEVATWPMFRLAVQGDVMVQAGDLAGLVGTRASGRFEVQPYVTATRDELRDVAAPGGEWDGEDDVEAGMDVRYAVTSTLNLNATVNPDFSQVEADALQIDRNQRFALFYPEKRPFFVEGGEIFNVGFELPYRMVYTRRIVDPGGGAKLTGQLGRLRVGAIAAWDRGGGTLAGTGAGDDAGVSRESVVGIARATFDIGEHSDAGLLVSNRTSRSDCGHCSFPGPTVFDGSTNTLVGGDTKIRLTRALSFYGVGALTSFRADSLQWGPSGRLELSDVFYSAFLFYNDGTRELGVYDDYLGPEFRNENGFAERVDYRQTGGFSNWTVRPMHSWVRDWEPFVDAFTVHDADGALVEWSSKQGMRAALHGQTEISVASLRRRLGWLGENFDLDEVVVEFENTHWRALAIELGARLGDDVLFGETTDETRKVWGERYALSATARPSPRLTSQIEVARNRLAPAFADGEIFDVWVMGAKTTYQFTRRLYARVFPQYDTDSRHFDADALLGYVLHPGSVLYLGVNGDFDHVNDRTRATSRSVFLKASYRFQP
jgi:hypothetical protein